MAIPAGNSQQPEALINSACRRLYLSSILINYLCINTTTNLKVPEEALADIAMSFILGTLPPAVFSNIVTANAPPAPAAIPNIELYKQGQYLFNDIKFDNAIFFNINFVNLSVVNAYNVFATVIIETRE